MVTVRNILLATVASALVSAAPAPSRSGEISAFDDLNIPINIEHLIDLDDKHHLGHKSRGETLEPRLIGGLQPIELPAITYEYSLRASSTNKHLGSCHFLTLLSSNKGYADFSKATEYKCSKKTRKCKSNGVGAKQAFILACVKSIGVYLPSGLN